MKNYKNWFILLLVISFLQLSFTSCRVVKVNNGKKKGWFKNPKNPHHPNTTNRKAKKNKNLY